MPIELREQKVMKSRFYRVAVPLMAMSDGRERWVEASYSGFAGLAQRPSDRPVGMPSAEDL
jgi:hypothetical protein